MNFATLKGLTIPVPQTIVPETTETSTIRLADDRSFGGSYVVTVDGVEYHCETFFNEMAEPSLGDSRLYSGDMSNPMEVPFYAVSWLADGWSLGDPTISETWVCDVFYPDSNAHTIDIKKMVDASVTQITDASGRVIWAVQNNKPVVLQVEKITSDTYAGETTHTGEQFILLDIYPKTASSTVNVTYGGLTKTLTFTGTNTQQVYFGTFNGVADSVATPASGELVIEGDCDGFAVSTYKTYNSTTSKTTNNYCSCITDVIDWGSVTTIKPYAFYNCSKLALTSLPSSITRITMYAFYGCTNLALTSLPSSVMSIADYAFYGCTNLALTSLPSSITSLYAYAFYGCKKLNIESIPEGVTGIGNYAFAGCGGLTTMFIPRSVTSIGNYAFSYCPNLSSVIISEGVTSIGTEAFRMAFDEKAGPLYSLHEVVLPSTIQNIGGNAFACASSNGNLYSYLDKLTILATTPPTAGSNCGGAQIIVPKGCGEAYKAAEGWSTYADKIVEAS